MPRGFDRSQRVADLIQKTLAEIIQKEMRDERFRMVTVMGVDVSRDFSYAKIYVSVMTDEEGIKSTIKGLNNAKKYLRHALANAIELRVVPELKFVYDDSNVRGYKITSLLHEVARKTDLNSDPDPDSEDK